MRVWHRAFLLAIVALLLAGAASGLQFRRRAEGSWEARRHPFVPYVEGRLILGSGSTFQIVDGFNFKLQ